MAIDFEDIRELDPWTDTPFSWLSLSSDNFLTGSMALAISSSGTDGQVETVATYEGSFIADVLIGNIFWPNRDDVNVAWAQICMYECFPLPLPREQAQWQAFVINLMEG